MSETNESKIESQVAETTGELAGTSRREVLAAIAVAGCCMTLGANDAFAQPAPGGGGGGGGGGGEDRVPAPKAGKSEIGPIADFAKDGIYDAHARTKQVFIVRAGENIVAVSSICTHKRCVLRKKDEATLKCPCHQAEFSGDGVFLKAPAKVSLAHYAVSIEEGKLIVDTSKSFEEKNWSDPAATAKVGAGATTKPA